MKYAEYVLEVWTEVFGVKKTLDLLVKMEEQDLVMTDTMICPMLAILGVRRVAKRVAEKYQLPENHVLRELERLNQHDARQKEPVVLANGYPSVIHGIITKPCSARSRTAVLCSGSEDRNTIRITEHTAFSNYKISAKEPVAAVGYYLDGVFYATGIADKEGMRYLHSSKRGQLVTSVYRKALRECQLGLRCLKSHRIADPKEISQKLEERMKDETLSEELRSGLTLLKTQLDGYAKPDSDEARVIVNRARYIVNIDFVHRPESPVGTADLRRALDREIYGQDALKTTLVNTFLAKQKQSERKNCILLVGPPGVGKTAVAKAFASACGFPTALISLAGVNNACNLRGFESSWKSAEVGQIAKAFYQMGTTEGVLILDELDKIGEVGTGGNPFDCIAALASAEEDFMDDYIGVPLSTKHTTIIATANNLKRIPEYVRDRFTVIHLNEYTAEEKEHIACEYLLPRLLRRYETTVTALKLKKEVVRVCATEFCADFGSRSADRNLEQLIAHQLAAGEERKYMTARRAREVLRKYTDEKHPLLRYNRQRELYAERVREQIIENATLMEDPCAAPFERQNAREKLELLVSLASEEKVGLPPRNAVYKTLDGTHFGQSEAKRLLCNAVYASAAKAEQDGNIRIGLLGDAGVGKTSLAKAFADAIGYPFEKISLSGMQNPADLKGLAHGMSKNDSGKIARAFAHAGTNRMVLLLDEIEKVGSLSVMDTLVELLDNQCTFTDNYLNVPLDLRNVILIATANDASRISRFVLDRLTLLQVEGYDTQERKTILSNYVVPALAARFGAGCSIVLEDGLEDLLTECYFPGNGVRSLEKGMERLVNDCICETGFCKGRLRITRADVERVYPEPCWDQKLPETVPAGCVSGLCVAGGVVGEVLPVESVSIRGDKVLVTGMTQDMIEQSAQIAHSLVNSLLGGALRGVHISYGDGHTPKNGDSAGMATAMALMSLGLNRPVSPKFAFTGAIRLSGFVDPVGGVEMKLEAAERIGCTEVFLPEENYRKLSDEFLQRLHIRVTPVTRFTEVANRVFPDWEKPSEDSSPRELPLGA